VKQIKNLSVPDPVRKPHSFRIGDKKDTSRFLFSQNFFYKVLVESERKKNVFGFIFKRHSPLGKRENEKNIFFGEKILVHSFFWYPFFGWVNTRSLRNLKLVIFHFTAAFVPTNPILVLGPQVKNFFSSL